MKQTRIAFSTPMVHAISEGRKSMTRRVVKTLVCSACKNPIEEQYNEEERETELTCWFCGKEFGTSDLKGWGGESCLPPCPYGSPGDQLLVTESAWMWCEKKPDGLTKKGRPKFRYVPVEGVAPVYVADRPTKPEQGDMLKKHAPNLVWRLKIPRFLPRYAIRTVLEIVSVKVERLQEISEDDAVAEGIEQDAAEWRNYHPAKDEPFPWYKSPIDSFQSLWESIHGEGSWKVNPWLSVIAFKRIEGRAA